MPKDPRSFPWNPADFILTKFYRSEPVAIKKLKGK